MNSDATTEHIEKALGTLKDFQRSTVDVLYRQFYEKDVRSMLVADEVGLGKTVVAKGLLAQILLQRASERRRRPFRVIYICSNQVIAKENLRKLHLFPDDAESGKPISRISYLAEAPEENERNGKKPLLQINTLTPATSFHISNSTGMQWERALIYGLLCKDSWLTRKNNRKGLSWLLKDGVGNIKRFRRQLSDAAGREFRPGLSAKFLKSIRAEMVPLNCETVYSHLSGARERTLYQAVNELRRQLENGRAEEARHSACQELAKRLRRVLIHCCLDYVDADLFILDEFQRFRDLIDHNSEEEQGLIARRIFGKARKKILLLSATPFKAFTGQADHENGEEHFADFRRVLTFLLNDNATQLAEYDSQRAALYRQLLSLRPGQGELNSEHREKVEEILRSRICRTERHIVGGAGNSMIEDSWKVDRLPFGTGDIRNFTLTDAVVRALEKATTVNGKPVEFCKSALYPFSFLERYQLKERLKANLKDKGVSEALENSRSAWIDLAKVDDYTWQIDSNGTADSPSHARLRLLADKALGNGGAEMLWVPPSLPYYKLKECFADDPGFTKTLLFSSWVMVPRMASTLLSYEVERRTIGNPKSRRKQEKGERVYFKKDRNPVPQITYEAKGEDRQLANMGNFTLLYPSQSLAAAILPKLNLKKEQSLAELKARAKDHIQALIDDLDLGRYVKRATGGERWYWAAPLLLDREQPHFREAVELWAADDNDDWDRETFFDTRGKKEPGVKERHAEEFVRCLQDPERIDLGPLPKDLAEVLADLALGSPAVLALRSLKQLFPHEETSTLMVHAFKVADQFCELFNKPESIAAIRLNAKQDSYWRMAANYSAAGCLQAVLDEYLHLLKGQNLDLNSLMDQLLNAINLNSASIKVDSLDTFLSGETKSMRCHYATTFGNQDFDRDSGQERATGIREVFNSPFRPFVLASTSIGQEGLDFHSYCRRIVHWNLPSNPIDLEQREGRINRYKSLVIRQQLAKRYRSALASKMTKEYSDIWDELFGLAETEERSDPTTCELVPYWHTDTDDYKIERVIPNFPFSQDQQKLERILKTLAIYRLAFGQPRQEELVEHLLTRGFSEDELKQIRETLIVNLCPVSYTISLMAPND